MPREVAERWRASAPGLARGRGARAWDSAAGRARGQLAGTGRGRPSTRGREREAMGMITIDYYRLLTDLIKFSLHS